MCPLLAGGAAMFAALWFVKEDTLILELALCDLSCPFAALGYFGGYVAVHRGGARLGLLRVLGRHGAFGSALLGKRPICFGLCTEARFSRGPMAVDAELWELSWVDAIAHWRHHDLIQLPVLNRCRNAHHL
eukprot:CAMPEP_0182850474 /NCGR_PEP_ID=MMETSP0006_2-20121128/30116_1 /TAXON_ID=97485 /ORGANISM="Prymnesium parvum, Strain Texoma1" /LENGTH=130 /DNA_ID=CAMNT_0024981087 /DNA_START=236 /DNA_END=628 /DNA_ORIENTATION=+